MYDHCLPPGGVIPPSIPTCLVDRTTIFENPTSEGKWCMISNGAEYYFYHNPIRDLRQSCGTIGVRFVEDIKMYDNDTSHSGLKKFTLIIYFYFIFAFIFIFFTCII